MIKNVVGIVGVRVGEIEFGGVIIEGVGIKRGKGIDKVKESVVIVWDVGYGGGIVGIGKEIEVWIVVGGVVYYGREGVMDGRMECGVVVIEYGRGCWVNGEWGCVGDGWKDLELSDDWVEVISLRGVGMEK